MTRLAAIRNTLYDRFFGVKNRTSEPDALREFLVIILGFLLLLAFVVGFIQFVFGLPTLIRTAGTVFSTILPAYLLARSGRVQTSVTWIAIGFTGFIVVTGILDTEYHENFSRIFDYVMPLVCVPVLAALVVRPGLALAASISNSLAIGLLFVVWETVQPQRLQSDDVITGLVIPLFVQLVLGIICTVLAERLRQMAQQSAEQTTLLKAILDALPVGVAIYSPGSPQQKPVYHNPYFETFTGAVDANSVKLVRREPHNVNEPDNLARPPVPASEWPWQTAAREDTFRESNATITHPDGRVVELHEETSGIYDPGTMHLLYILYVATNVGPENMLNLKIRNLYNDTQHQWITVNESYERLTELDRLKGEFLANVSHELRTPLSIILVNTQVMQVAHQPESLLVKNIDAIFAAANHLRTLVNDILDAAKLDSNQLMIDRQLLDLRKPVESAAQAMEILAAEKQLRLVVTVPDQPVMVMGDERRLAQIALNLLSNAIKFTQRGTVSIQVTTCLDEPAAHISVQDTGIGIDPALQSYLFERFVQIRPTSGKRGGTGIGLSIARSLAKLHDGNVWLKQSSSNQGSTFVCKIPLAPQTIPAEITTPL